MKILFVGVSGKTQTRINNHRKGNVEGSALRKNIATQFGFKLVKNRRPSGSIKISIDLQNRVEGENLISAYLKSGHWTFIECESSTEAEELKWFILNRVNPKPKLNVDTKGYWDEKKEKRYTELAEILTVNKENGKFLDINDIPQKAGVHFFINSFEPSEFYKKQKHT